jgi:TrmH family RNA methyltransferase
MEITSVSNPRIRRLAALRDRRQRDEEGVFVVEGSREMGRAVAAGVRLLEIYHDPARFPRPPHPAPAEFAVAAEALDRASYRSRSQGVLGVFEQLDVSLANLAVSPNPLYLVAESIEKPGNLGALLRTADATGATGVIVADPGVDPFNPNVIRSSTGTLFSVSLAVTTPERATDWLREREVGIYAADPAGSRLLWEVDLTTPVALLVGSEHAGLSEWARSVSDDTVTIPMHGTADSLNVSVSMAVLAYEAVRQRRGRSSGR